MFKSKVQIRLVPCLCLQPFYIQKLSSYPKIFDLRGENSTHSSWVSCPGSFRWTNQSKNGAKAAARAVKLSQHSWRYTVAGTDFLHEAGFSPHTGRFRALQKYFASCFFFLPYFRIAFATPNPPINLTLCYLYRDLRAQCVTTVEFAGSAQTVDIYNPPSSQEPWRMQTKTRLTNTGDPFVVIIVSNKKIHR